MFIICAGLDRSGKTTLASTLQDKYGFKVIHFGAPDKKYSQPGYTGPSYVEDLIDQLTFLSGQNVVFDRSWYGEVAVWPEVYGRKPQLSIEDMQILKEIEDQNDTKRIFMTDLDVRSHWDRCVANKEPLTLQQFKHAHKLYGEMADKYEFTPCVLSAVLNGSIFTTLGLSTGTTISEEIKPQPESIKNNQEVKDMEIPQQNKMLTKEQQILQQANVINEILSSRILKKKNEYYDAIEGKLRDFLNNELAVLLGMNVQKQSELTRDEISFLRILIGKAKGGK